MKKSKVNSSLSFAEKSRLILQKLKEKPERKGELTELLSELEIDFISSDIDEYSNYFDERNYAMTTLYKGGCFLILTNCGLDYLRKLDLKGNKKHIKLDFKWLITILISSGILIFAGLNWRSNNLKRPVEITNDEPIEENTIDTLKIEK